MNGDEFYEEFKAGLYYLNLNWGEKDKAKVFVKDGFFWMRCGHRSIRLNIPVEE